MSLHLVLVDTSVWVQSQSSKQSEQIQDALASLLASSRVVAHDLVQLELMLGTGKNRKELVDNYSLLTCFASRPNSEVIRLVEQRGLAGRGIGAIDTHLLAACLHERGQLWTLDTKLHEVAVELNCAYDGPG